MVDSQAVPQPATADQYEPSRNDVWNGVWDDDRVWELLVGDLHVFAEHWGRRALMRSAGADFAWLFDVGDAEQLLASGLRRPAFRLVRDGITLPNSSCTRPVRLGGSDLDDVADVERIAAAFVAGATVVFQGLHRTHPRVRTFARSLARTSGHRIQVNAYLTPPAEHGLAAHSDGHDVLVLHVSGEKRWCVDGLGELVLRPGDVLYVPAGVEHEAQATDGASLHLTVGVLRVTMRQIISRLLDAAEELDRPAPLRFVGPDRDAFVDDIAHAVEVATEALGSIDADHAADEEVQRAVRRQRASMHGVLTSAAGLSAIDGATSIALRPEVRIVPDAAGSVRLDLGGRSLSVPSVASRALAHLAASGGCRVDELPALDATSRLVLVRRLVRERLATSASSASSS